MEDKILIALKKGLVSMVAMKMLADNMDVFVEGRDELHFNIRDLEEAIAQRQDELAHPSFKCNAEACVLNDGQGGCNSTEPIEIDNIGPAGDLNPLCQTSEER